MPGEIRRPVTKLARRRIRMVFAVVPHLPCDRSRTLRRNYGKGGTPTRERCCTGSSTALNWN